jgi:citrate lyase beta subunit
MGFTGCLCATQQQVTPVNDGFTPARNEVGRAEKVRAAFQRSSQSGRTRVKVSGRYYDAFKAGRCMDIVCRAQACAQRDEEKKMTLEARGEQ